jgi:hypothetical protein
MTVAAAIGGCAVNGDAREESEGTRADAFIGPDDPPPPKRGPITPAPSLALRTNSGGEFVSFTPHCGGNADVSTLTRRPAAAPNGWITIEQASPCIALGDVTIQPVTDYCYRLTSQNSDHLAHSNEVCLRTDRYRRPPEAPSFVKKSVASGSIALTFHDVSKIESGYRLERSESNGWRVIQTLASPQPGTDFTMRDTTVEPDQTYLYRVVAYHAWDSSASEAVEIASFPTPPRAPANLRTTFVATNVLNIAWDDRSSNEDGFRVHYTDYRGKARTEDVNRNDNDVALGTFSPGSRNCMTVEAYNDAGSAFSDEACFYTSSTPTPTPPSLPDLFFTSATTNPGSPFAGNPVTAEFTLCNNGAAAGAFHWAVALDGSRVAYDAVAGLAGGACITRSAPVSSSFPAGSHSVDFVADVDGEVSEAYENNNVSHDGIIAQ